MLKASYTQQTITPDLSNPVYLAGYDSNTRALSIHDALYARALVLTHGGTRIALVALDLLGLSRHHCLEIEERARASVGDIDLLLACSHTHYGPDTIGLWGPDMMTSGVDPNYMIWLKDRIVTTVINACRVDAQPVQVRSAAAEVEGVVKNIRDPHILDKEVTCAQFRKQDGGILATLMIFPCHPETLSKGKTAITSDYVYALREKVETDTNAPAMFMAGALGGLMTPDVEEFTHEAAAKVGETIAEVGLKALAGAAAGGPESLWYERREVVVPLNNIIFEQAMDIGLLPRVTNDAGEFVTEVGLIKIGGIWLATVPGELLPALGITIKGDLREAGAPVAGVVGLANDEIGYILPEDEYVYPENPLEPGDHYEETMSLGPKTAPLLMKALAAIITN